MNTTTTVTRKKIKQTNKENGKVTSEMKNTETRVKRKEKKKSEKKKNQDEKKRKVNSI